VGDLIYEKILTTESTTQKEIQTKKEKNGTKSLVFNSVLQEKQIERLFKKDKPVPYLFATTQTKLPKATPNKNIIIPNKYCINYIIPQKSKNAP